MKIIELRLMVDDDTDEPTVIQQLLDNGIVIGAVPMEQTGNTGFNLRPNMKEVRVANTLRIPHTEFNRVHDGLQKGFVASS